MFQQDNEYEVEKKFEGVPIGAIRIMLSVLAMIIIVAVLAFCTRNAEAKPGQIVGKVRRPNGALVINTPWILCQEGEVCGQMIGQLDYGHPVRFTGLCSEGHFGKYAQIYYKGGTAWIWWWYATNSPCQPRPSIVCGPDNDLTCEGR